MFLSFYAARCIIQVHAGFACMRQEEKPQGTLLLALKSVCMVALAGSQWLSGRLLQQPHGWGGLLWPAAVADFPGIAHVRAPLPRGSCLGTLADCQPEGTGLALSRYLQLSARATPLFSSRGTSPWSEPLQPSTLVTPPATMALGTPLWAISSSSLAAVWQNKCHSYCFCGLWKLWVSEEPPREFAIRKPSSAQCHLAAIQICCVASRRWLAYVLGKSNMNQKMACVAWSC